MFRKEKKCWFAVMVVLALLSVSAGRAEAAEGPRRGEIDVWSRLATWIGEKTGALQALWGEYSSSIDPNGRVQVTAVDSDYSSSIDPNGQH